MHLFLIFLNLTWTTHIPNCWCAYHYTFSILCFLSLIFSTVLHSCLQIVFKICIAALDFLYYQCQFYMEFPTLFCLPVFPILPLWVTVFCLCTMNWYLQFLCILLVNLAPYQFPLHGPYGFFCSCTPSWEVSCLATCCTHFPIHWALSWCVASPTVPAWLSLVCCNMHFSFLGILWLCSLFYIIKCLDFCNIIQHGCLHLLCFDPFSPHNTSSLVICTLPVLDVNSLIISSSMILSFKPWINCSLSCLSISLYWHSAAAISKCPAHSSVLSSSLLHHFINYSNFIVSLNCGQNVVDKVLNNPWRVLHACFSASVMLSM